MNSTISVVNSAGEVEQVKVDVADSEVSRRAARAAAIRRARQSIEASAFFDRLTDAEYAALVNAARQQVANGNVQLSRWLDRIRANGSFHPASDRSQVIKAALVTAGLLTQARADTAFSP